MDQLAPLLVIPVLAVIAVVTLFRLGIFGKKMLPLLPESGALPVAELAKYYDRESPVAWERVRGWELNQPIDLNGPAPIDHVVLTDRLLDFCTGASGKLTLVFNFLVEAIQTVTFEPAPSSVGSVAPDQGLVTIYTPSGQTRLLATGHFARILQQAVAKSSSVRPPVPERVG
jgi:hypothetical protein